MLESKYDKIIEEMKQREAEQNDAAAEDSLPPVLEIGVNYTQLPKDSQGHKENRRIETQ